MQLHGAIKKFCNSVWCRNDAGKHCIILFYIISIHINTFLTSVTKVPHSSQIVFFETSCRDTTPWPAWTRHRRKTIQRCFFRCQNRQTSLGARSVEWGRWDSCSTPMSLTATRDMCAGALSCSSSRHRVSIPLRFSSTAWRLTPWSPQLAVQRMPSRLSFLQWILN